MSKVAIVGDPSGTGTFTISAPNGNTDRTLVLPDEAGTVLTSAGVPASAMPAGSVIQVKEFIDVGSYIATTSTSFVDTGIHLAITPSSASSKILVIANFNANTGGGAGSGIRVSIRRNGSTFLFGGNNGPIFYDSNAGYVHSQGALIKLDSPNTTASTDYSIWIASQSGSQAGIARDWGDARILLMEIAA